MRVTEYCIAMAESMGVAGTERKSIELAAILHDVGKIGVPESILLKKSKLTDEEFSQIKIHPIKGESIIKQVVELKNKALIVRAHHERYDGRRYPDGLAKQNIPLGVRIMSVADSYDAMTSNRPYRMSLSHNTAVKEIVKNSGTQFDPEVVEHFLKLADYFNSIKAVILLSHNKCYPVRRIPVHEAFDLLCRESDVHFNWEIVEAFISFYTATKMAV